MTRRDSLRSGDFVSPTVGGALIATLGLWLVSHPAAWRTLMLLLGCGVALVASRRIARGTPWLIPAVAVGALTLALLVDVPGTFSSRPLAGPLGYANAKAALYAQGSVAALMLALGGARFRAGRWTGWIAAIVFAMVPLGSRSMAATLGLAGLAALLLVPRRWYGIAVLCCGLSFLVILAATLIVAAEDDNRVAPVLDERRVVLWGDAWAMMTGHPVRGVGAGGFAETSPAAASDRDARWAHNEFLELGAEYGIPALVLTMGLVLWMLWELAVWAFRGERTAVLGAGAVTMVAAHACVDYIGHFAALPLLGTLLVGAALGSRRESHKWLARWSLPSHSTRA